MPTNIVGKINPNCPLCGKMFERAVHGEAEYYFCRKCKVQIFANDPMVNFWNDNKSPDDGEGIPCPNQKCRSEMKIFCRSDGYVKAVCKNPRCGAEVESHAIKDGHYDVKKGEGADNITIVKSDARKNWKDN